LDYLSEDWVISSAGGNTGKAFVARSKKEKLFIKRNSSPFLAVLSAEGIVPKLLWTKRLENGDVITAQKWLEGRKLSAEEMKSSQVIGLLRKIHMSKPLAFMLSRLGKAPLTPKKICQELLYKSKQLEATDTIEHALKYLVENADTVKSSNLAVCHCDINHNNWLMDENGQLYLVDWDQAMLADPVLDLSMILYWYVEPNQWANWLKEYGRPLTDQLKSKLRWYIVAHHLVSFFWHQEEKIKDEVELNRLMEDELLKDIFN